MIGYVLDESLLHHYAFGDNVAVGAIAALDSRSYRLCVPAVTLVYAQAGLSADQCAELNGVIANLDSMAIADLGDIWHITDMAGVLAEMGRDSAASAAHVVAVAKRLEWPILTCDRSSWHELEHGRLEIIEVADGD
ncbi:hypothetical protein [Nocardia sp. XZ_19_385]|uniref:hypothetical protein n=1 Tax=Nocardia sp. XZ_19_385 TaxID=2769488 RepID=UPI0018905B5F|nr:hypothetical protein [Nocardia sp. XZ_19_385]